MRRYFAIVVLLIAALGIYALRHLGEWLELD
jgi:hypothetical protein